MRCWLSGSVVVPGRRGRGWPGTSPSQVSAPARARRSPARPCRGARRGHGGSSRCRGRLEDGRVHRRQRVARWGVAEGGRSFHWRRPTRTPEPAAHLPHDPEWPFSSSMNANFVDSDTPGRRRRPVVEGLIAAGHWCEGDPEIWIVGDTGYDGPRLAFLLADLPVRMLVRVRSDRVMAFPAPPRRAGTVGRSARHGADFTFKDPGPGPRPRTPRPPRPPDTAPHRHNPGIGCIPN